MKVLDGIGERGRGYKRKAGSVKKKVATVYGIKAKLDLQDRGHF